MTRARSCPSHHDGHSTSSPLPRWLAVHPVRAGPCRSAWLGCSSATAWCAYFFRDPERVTPRAPAVGGQPRRRQISRRSAAAVPPRELGLGNAKLTRISVFHVVFACLSCRAPVRGRITKVEHRAGQFLNAELDKASERERAQRPGHRQSARRPSAAVQIAGLVARRIVCWVEAGASVGIGERFGLIRFGSRVDVFLPRRRRRASPSARPRSAARRCSPSSPRARECANLRCLCSPS